MTEITDLEIGLHRRTADTYAVELRCTRPDSDTDTRRDGEALFDLAALQELGNDPAAYGLALHQSLFADPAVLSTFGELRAITQDKEMALRLRLMVGPSAPELHNLRWETLRDPQNNQPLSTSQNLLFTRYLSSMDWRAVRLRPKSALRALVVIANPSDLAASNLAPIDVQAESTRAKTNLGDIPVTLLPDGDRRATLKNIIACLNDVHYDILYLVCHGALVKDEPRLWLENDAGTVERVAGIDLAAQLSELQEHPRLAVLASCQSAGGGAGEALAALGPRLAQSGIPAVIAMQGNVSMETVAQFMPVFFKELQKDGQIDRAMAAARAVVRDRPDSWMPALFMRLKSGRIWYIPNFGGDLPGGDREDFEKWEALKRFIQRRKCTPIIGPGLTESLLGSQSEIALHWAKENRYPFAANDRENLPSIAEYIVRRDGPEFLRIAFQEALQQEIMHRCGECLPADLRQDYGWSEDDLLRALAEASEHCWANRPNDPHRLLAELRMPIYITTSPGNLLSCALIRAGANPQVRICPWWGDRVKIPPEKWDFEERPTPEAPLVYHLFGHISLPESLVLSEDNYFDFLIGVTRNKDMIPASIRDAMTRTALLFLGFRTDEWSFRVLFRTLMAQPGSEQFKLYSHVAAQIEPEEDRMLDARRARRHLERYFESEKISIYWGRPEEFLSSLSEHLHGD